MLNTFELWSAHTVNMLSWHLASQRFYDAHEVVLALAFAIATSWSAMRTAAYGRTHRFTTGMAAAALLSLGIGAVYLTGIAALHLTPGRWDLLRLARSLAVTALLAYAAMQLLLEGGGASGAGFRLPWYSAWQPAPNT